MRKVLCVAVAMMCAGMAGAQQAKPLTDDEVSAAIAAGLAKRPVHLSLQDEMGGCNTCPTTGFSMGVYTPAQWIASQAFRAKRKMNTFTLADVTPEMRAPVLHVDASPDLPNNIGGTGAASSVQKVVLADELQQTLIQSLSSQSEDVDRSNAFRDFTYKEVEATFSLDDVAKVRAMSPKGEFFIVVVGDHKNKPFKIKEKMLPKLF